MTKPLSVAEWQKHLASAGQRMHPQASRVLNKGAMNIRDDWKKRAARKNPVHAKKYASSIAITGAKVIGGDLVATVEPRLGPAAKFGVILEYGGPHSAPQRSNAEAMAAEAPNLAHWVAKVAAECL